MANASWNGASGNWNTPSDWSTNQVPGSGDTATIAAAGTYTVDVTGAAVGQLVLDQAAAALAVPGSLALGGTLAAEAGTLDLSGTITGGNLLAEGAGIAFQGGTLDGVEYQGALVLSGSSTDLVITGSFTDIAPGGGTGTIGVTAGATLDIALNTTLPALLGTVANSGGTLEISGTLNDAGQTLAVTPGGPFDNLILAGVIAGGSIAVEGGSIVYDAGTLDGVGFQGPLDLSADYSSIGIMGGFHVQAAGGGLDGITVTGLLGGLAFLDAETLDNAVVTLGGSGNQDRIYADAALTLGPGVSITEAGTLSEASFDGTGTITNRGLITAAFDDEVLVDAAGFVNLGTIAVTGGTLLAGSAISGTGAVDLSAVGVFAAYGGVSGQQVAFLDGTGTLDLVAPASFGGTITGFRPGDTITLANTTLDTLSYSNGILTVGGTIAGSLGTAALDVPGSYTASDFGYAQDGHGNTVIAVACFAAGTRILTPAGDVAVEKLRVGDRVRTLTGAAAITWIGRRRLDPRRHPHPDAVRPVRIERGAIADEMPRRDLRVSPDHALFLDGVLIPAKVLVNGATIRPCPEPGPVGYFHIELPAHDILLAEGMPAESYLDTGNRSCFANAAVTTLHPGFRVHRPEESCAPLCVRGPLVETVRARLLRRAEALGHRTTADPDLRLIADGDAIRPRMVEAGVRRFRLPGSAETLAIASRAGAPADVMACPDDRRVLGVAISGIVLHTVEGRREIALDDPALTEGWHGLEADGVRAWRWTNGNAGLQCPGGGEAIEIRVSGTLPYRIRQPSSGTRVPQPYMRQDRER